MKIYIKRKKQGNLPVLDVVDVANVDIAAICAWTDCAFGADALDSAQQDLALEKTSGLPRAYAALVR